MDRKITHSLAHRLRCGGGHFVFSACVAAAVAAVVFFIWYPYPYRSISGGLHLFLLLVLVDVSLGPLATFVVSHPDKSLREWRVDVILIVLLQLGALGYGMWTLHQARPVYLAFEIDRLRVVTAADVSEDLLAKASQGFSKLPQWGPGLVAVRPFLNEGEKFEATMAALQGVDLAFRPEFWVSYSQAHDVIRSEVKPLDKLLEQRPHFKQEILRGLEKYGLELDDAVYLPLHARTTIWTAVIDRNSLRPVFYAPLDPYGS